jgi:hypothetical protein
VIRAPWLRACLAVAFAAGCGGGAEGARSSRSAQTRGSHPPAPAPARATRFAPDSARSGLPAELAAFCQLARRDSADETTPVDTLAMPRSPRSLVGLDVESLAMRPLRCVVRGAAEWKVVRSGVLRGSPRFDRPVDFRREMRVVGSAGTSQPMFSQLWIDGTWSRGDTLVVAVRHLVPGGSGTDSDDGSPVAVVVVPRVSGPVFFVER